MTQESPSPDDIPLLDALDRDILLHREIHFGGKFVFMLDYYRQGRPGINPEFPMERIEALQQIEQETQQNLAALYLSGAEAEKIADKREAYKKWRDLYEHAGGKKTPGVLLADLILTEKEDPEEEIAAVVAEKDLLLPLLLDLLRNPDSYDLLSPGYGRAPELAVRCLQRMGDKRAIISLFESIGTGGFFDDDQIFFALKTIGNPAKEFLLRVVGSKPITEDNEKAAMALSSFSNDEEVGLRCLDLLQEEEMRSDVSLAPYLFYATEALADTPYKERWLTFIQQTSLPPTLEPDQQRMRQKYE